MMIMGLGTSNDSFNLEKLNQEILYNATPDQVDKPQLNIIEGCNQSTSSEYLNYLHMIKSKIASCMNSEITSMDALLEIIATTSKEAKPYNLSNEELLDYGKDIVVAAERLFGYYSSKYTTKLFVLANEVNLEYVMLLDALSKMLTAKIFLFTLTVSKEIDDWILNHNISKLSLPYCYTYQDIDNLQPSKEIISVSSKSYKVQDEASKVLSFIGTSEQVKKVQFLKLADVDLEVYWGTQYQFRPGYSNTDLEVKLPIIFGAYTGVYESNRRTTKLYNTIVKSSDLYLDQLDNPDKDPFGGNRLPTMEECLTQEEISSYSKFIESLSFEGFNQIADHYDFIDDENFRLFAYNQVVRLITSDILKESYFGIKHLLINLLFRLPSSLTQMIQFKISKIDSEPFSAIFNLSKVGLNSIYYGQILLAVLLAGLGCDILFLNPCGNLQLITRLINKQYISNFVIGLGDSGFKYSYSPSLFTKIRKL